MTTLTVTATQGGSTAPGILLRIFVITGAKTVANQTGGALNLGFASNTNAWTGSVTTTSGSNFYGGASMSGSGNSPTGTATTIVDAFSDTTNAETYCTFKALNVTSGATTRGVQASPAAAGTLGAFEVLAATTLAEDASAPGSQPFTNTAANPATVTSGSFTPPGGSLIVAIVVADGGASSTTMSVTDNLGSHLNWTQKTANPAAGEDYAGVWMADVPAAAAGGISQAQPGQTWLRAFHHRQAPAQPVTAAPVITSGPPVYPLTGPIGLGHRLPPPTSGSAGGSPGLFAQQGPPVTPLRGPVRARQPLPPRGRTSSNPGTRQQTGPPVTPLRGPVLARQPLPRRGRCAGSQGTFTAVIINSGPPVYPLHGAVRTRPQPPPRGRCAGSRGIRAQTGPPVYPLHGPVAPFRPGPFRPGRTGSDPGMRSQTGAPVYPLHRPVRGQPARPVLTGRADWRTGVFTFVPPPAFQVARSAPTVTDPVTSAAAVADPRDGTNTVTDPATSSPSVS